MHEPDRTFCICCNSNEINDATFRYVEIISKGLEKAGYHNLGISRDRKVLKASDLIVTISCLSAMRALIWRPKGKLLHWFQGIEAVERRFLHRGWRGNLRYILWSAMEALLIRRADFKMFVSQEMREFLHDRNLPQSRSIVMPCYNANFDEEVLAQDPTRYDQLNIVYAGSMYPWQCVDDSIQTFREIQRIRPDATMTIYTREVSTAREKCHTFGAKNIKVETISPTELTLALKKFSFGFILRDEMPINYVSTPTKLSTYIAAGVIPVITNATPALCNILKSSPGKVIAENPTQHRDIAQQVVETSQNRAMHPKIGASFSRVFEEHYNDTLYISRIASTVLSHPTKQNHQH